MTKYEEEVLMTYIDYVEAQIDADLMPSKFLVWLEKEFEGDD